MNTNRNGKIARLPRYLRDELSRRIDNGVPGPEILQWINAQPGVKEILDRYFQGRPIRQQNLSEWCQGGYQDWFKLQETRNLTLQIAHEPETMDDDSVSGKISEAFATIATAEFVKASQTVLRETTGTLQRWQCVRKIHDQLSRLRRDNHRADLRSLREQQSTYQMESAKRTAAQAARLDERRQILAHLQPISGFPPVKAMQKTPENRVEPAATGSKNFHPAP